MKKITHFLFLITSLAIMMNACRKDESSDTDSSTTTNTAQVNATISGIVTDENNQPVIGAQVITGGLTTSTDHYGIFLLKGNVTKSRCVIRITKAGFLNRSHAFIPKENTVNYIRIVLGDEPAAQNISATTGGTVSIGGGGSIQFAANSFVINGSAVPYTGTVNVVATHLAPGSANFGLMIPGGDLTGKNTSGDDVSLYSFGMTGATLKGSGGEDLQLAAGTTATITFPIGSGQQGLAPSSIPLWYLDEETILWKEEGTATKVGNNYVGTVAHFSIWNVDYGGPRATINGRVVDCEGIPQANVIVTINGGVTVVTDANGYYTTWVPSGWALTFQMLPQGVIVLPSQLENVAPLTTGQTFTVPNLIIPCGSRINGHISNCSNEPISGIAILLLNNNVVSTAYTTTGSFRLTCIENTSYALTCISDNGNNSILLTSPQGLDSVDVGTLQLCDNNISSTTNFSISGNGYNYRLVNFTVPNINNAFWTSANNYTHATIAGYSTLGSCSLQFNISGHQPITIDFSSNQDSSFFDLFLEGVNYMSSGETSNPFILEITHYGNVGDSIKGNFYGTLKNWFGLEVVISNGKFAFPRTPDH